MQKMHLPRSWLTGALPSKLLPSLSKQAHLERAQRPTSMFGWSFLALRRPEGDIEAIPELPLPRPKLPVGLRTAPSPVFDQMP